MTTARPAVVRAGLALLLVGVAAACATTPEARTPAPAPGHTWSQTHVVDLAPGWRVTARNVGTVDESTSLSGPGGAGCLVSAWSSRPGRHARPVSPRAVPVQGRDATYGNLDPDYGPYPRAVVWRDADDRWFGVACDVEETELLRVAAGVHAGRNPMAVPFRLRSSVEGAAMVQLIETRDDETPAMTALFEADGPGRTPTMEISSGRAVPGESGPAARERIGGRVVEVRRSSQSLCLPVAPAPVCVVGPGDEPASDWAVPAYAVARRTVERLEPVEDLSDRASWIDADDAFPR